MERLFPVSDIFNITIDKIAPDNKKNWTNICERIRAIFTSDAEIIQIRRNADSFQLQIYSENKYFVITVSDDEILVKEMNDEVESETRSTKSSKEE